MCVYHPSITSLVKAHLSVSEGRGDVSQKVSRQVFCFSPQTSLWGRHSGWAVCFRQMSMLSVFWFYKSMVKFTPLQKCFTFGHFTNHKTLQHGWDKNNKINGKKERERRKERKRKKEKERKRKENSLQAAFVSWILLDSVSLIRRHLTHSGVVFPHVLLLLLLFPARPAFLFAPLPLLLLLFIFNFPISLFAYLRYPGERY